MSKKRILLIGSGKRAHSVILPALYCLKDEYELVSIFSRSIKDISLFGDKWRFRTVNELSAINFEDIDIIIIAVSLPAVPDVLRKLSVYNLKHIRLMIDTPVLPHNKLGSASFFNNFKEVTVSEDNLALPAYVLSKSLIDGGKIGRPKHVYMWHSGFKFHALAAMKKMFDSVYVKKIKNVNLGNGFCEKLIGLSNGVIVHVFEPRSYSVGRFLIVGSHGSIADYPLNVKNTFVIGYNMVDGVYRNLVLDNVELRGDRLDSLYSKNIPDNLWDSTLNTTLKIRGLISLIADDKNAIKYSALDGIYDMMAIKIADKIGFFFDFPLGKNSSFFRLLLKSSLKFFKH